MSLQNIARTWSGTTTPEDLRGVGHCSYRRAIHRIKSRGGASNINGMKPSEYIQLYNTVVPAMVAVDNTIKISALELSVADPRTDLPPFVASPASGGVNAQVDVASTHFYPTCNQRDADAPLFDRVAGMVQYINYVYQQLGMRADLKSVPIWVTENNGNADFDNGSGMSTCIPGQKFVVDPRGTSAFF